MRSLPTYLFDENSMSSCHRDLLAGLRRHFDDLPHLKAVAGKRKAFESHLKAIENASGMLDSVAGNMSFNLIAGDSGIPAQAVFKVDLQIKCDSRCGNVHCLDIELCIQNREAIGTNFLKLELLAGLQPEADHVGVVICPDSRYYATSNMDSAYADDDEYVVAHKLAYHHVLKHKMVVLSVLD